VTAGAGNTGFRPTPSRTQQHVQEYKFEGLSPGLDATLRLAPVPGSRLSVTVIVGKGAPVSRGGTRRETPYPVHAVANVLEKLAGTPDVFLSTHQFQGWRRTDLVRRLCSIIIDLDYGHHASSRWAGHPPEDVAAAVLAALESARVPAPCRIVSSGRGLYVQWLIEPTSARAAPRYRACVRRLATILADWSPDQPAGTRLTSYFRVVGTVHSGTGTLVREVWRAPTPHRRWAFDDLAGKILPVNREVLRQTRREQRARASMKIVTIAAARAERRASGDGTRPPTTLSRATWGEALVEGVTRYVDGLGGQLQEGARDRILFVLGVGLAWCTPAGVPLRAALERYAQAWAGWTPAETADRLSAIMDRAEAAAAGKTIKWRGRDVDPRYTMRAETIREWLGITGAEARANGIWIALDDEGRKARHYERRAVVGAECGQQLRSRANKPQRGPLSPVATVSSSRRLDIFRCERRLNASMCRSRPFRGRSQRLGMSRPVPEVMR
jgi:hypothetical protein